MSFPHVLLALLVALVWGVNFIAAKLALLELSPLLLCSLRFFLSSVPLVFFIKRPSAPFRLVVAYGLVMFALQFSLLFLGMYVGMTGGMASLLMQAQVFFSLFFAVFFLNEQLSIWQILGAIISFLGIFFVGLHLDANITFLGFLCVLGSAASWGWGNLISKKMIDVNKISLVIWGSFIATWPMLLLSICFEGPAKISQSLQNLTWMGVNALLYIVYLSTWVGYGLWNWLIARYPVSKVVPFILLVPIFGMLTSVLVLGETLQAWKITSILLVISGLCINLFGNRLFRRDNFRFLFFREEQ